MRVHVSEEDRRAEQVVRRAAAFAIACAAALASPIAARADGPDGADAGDAAPARLVALVAADDARRAVAIGRGGEVYEPDGKGGWVHRLAWATATPVAAAGRAGGAIVAIGDGVIYRLAANGWSAIRLVQRGKAILGHGARALAAAGRQLFALDPLTRGEPTRLAQAPGAIVAIGAGATGAVVAVEASGQTAGRPGSTTRGAGLFRLAGGKLVALRQAIGRARLVSDRWAIVDRGAIDLATGRLAPWPDGLTAGPAIAAPDGALAVIAAGRDGLELVRIAAGAAKLAREPLGVTGTAVGVVVDRAGRAVVALADGRIAERGAAGWSTTEVTEEPAATRPGAAAATAG